MNKQTVSGLKPKQLLRKLASKMPTVWDQIKAFRKAKGTQLPDWPNWCYMPLTAGHAISSVGGARNENLYDLLLNPASIIALATWRVSQGVYRFDPELYNELVHQPFEGNLPCETLKRLPEWCVYIETPDLRFAGTTVNKNVKEVLVEGFFAHLEHDEHNQREELRLLMITNIGLNVPFILHIGNWTIVESLEMTRKEANKYLNEEKQELPPFSHAHAAMITPFLQLVLYLCAENADIPVKPTHPNTRVRMSGQVDVPKEPRLWTVGERIGASIHKYRNEERQRISNTETSGTHASPRPHIRRAHWHHFWTGPKTGKQNIVLRWLSPIPVGYNEEQEMPIVIRKVK